jgi:SNF2 family DNA or RNA helicase
MTSASPVSVAITYDPIRITGQLIFGEQLSSSIRERLQQAAMSIGQDYVLHSGSIELPWPGVLALVREFGQQQKTLNFRFRPVEGDAKDRLSQFVAQYRKVQEAKGQLTLTVTTEEIGSRLKEAGFTKRILTDFQLRDVQQLLSLQNGANFSVPGAGKTTVSLALHLLTRKPGQHFLVVGPKAAFPAWREVILECVADDAPGGNAEPFTILSGSGEAIRRGLASGATRFVINYDLLIQSPEIFTAYLARQPVHLLLDEAHRMKAGYRSQRGAFLLNVAPLPVRRDILTGTPMPQHPADLQSQLDFLWPGAGLGMQIAQGIAPRDVLGHLYVRTTKEELGLPKPNRRFIRVPMAKGQMALYSIVRDQALLQFSKMRTDVNIDIIGAKKSVMRLLQLSANPVLALRSIVDDVAGVDSGIVDQVIAEGASTKMREVAAMARNLAKEGRKTVIWTIFTDTIHQMEDLLADLNPVSLYGMIPSGEPSDLATREGRLHRFHVDPMCQVMLANPAAAGEGISLHHVCHDALYIDRSYVSTHYLQSIDRIHRLGLPPDVETNVSIFQTMTPRGLGSIDHSVSRRLAQKLRALQVLLDDPDLHQIALDEENADDPVDYDVDPADIIDLIEQLEGRAVYSDDEAE